MQAETPEPVRSGRVIIADDHELARLGLRTMLEPEPDLEVVGEAATGARRWRCRASCSRTWC